MKIKDIARELHLSVSTVSKALNGGFDISKETKEQVLEYAKAHGYKSRDERLKVKNLRRLCFIYDNVNLANQTNIINPLSLAFSKYARLNNFEVITIPVETINENYSEFMITNNFDGAFIAGLNYKSPFLKELKNATIPAVLYDNNLIEEKIATINNENINTISELITILKNLGHTKIGFINGDKDSFVSNERFAGYIIGLTVNNIKFAEKYVYMGDFNERSGFQAAEYFANTDVTAVVCACDTIAIGLINGLEKCGIKVPQDISVTGYDDLDIARFFKPKLTTIRQDLELIGERAFYLLTSMLMNRSSQRIVINGQIIIRESIAKVNKK